MRRIFSLGLVGSLLNLRGRWVGTSWVALILSAQWRQPITVIIS